MSRNSTSGVFEPYRSAYKAGTQSGRVWSWKDLEEKEEQKTKKYDRIRWKAEQANRRK
jgi:hypothetical protein